MKAWRQQKSTGWGANHRAQKAVNAQGRFNHNQFFGASLLLQSLFKRVGLWHE